MPRRITGTIAAALLAAPMALVAADAPWPGDGFSFSPMPRWHVEVGDEPGYREVCKAVEAECGEVPEGGIEVDFGYDELYNASGMLIGLRVTQSTGCRALDESQLLDKRGFIKRFSTPGRPDLDDVTLEYADGVDPADVRMVRARTSVVGLGCP